MNREDWLSFIRARAKILFLLLVIICSGSLYAAYMVKKGSVSSEITNQYFSYKPDKLDGCYILFCLWKYLKKLLLIFAMGLISWMIPLSLGFVVVYIFAYSFSVAAFLATMEIKAHIVVLISLLVQSVIMIAYLVELFEFLLERFLRKGQADKGKIVIEGVKGLCVCVGATLIQLGTYYIS